MTSSASIVPLYFRYSTIAIQHDTSCYRNHCSCGIHHCRTTPHLQLASQVHRWDGTAQIRCRGEDWLNPCYTNMLTCKPHPTPVHFTKEPTLWGSLQWLTLQPLSSGPSLICTHCWIVHFGLPLAPVTTNVKWLAECMFWVVDGKSVVDPCVK